MSIKTLEMSRRTFVKGMAVASAVASGVVPLSAKTFHINKDHDLHGTKFLLVTTSVFDGSIYNYSLPLSLQRESLYFKQRLYDIDFTDSINKKYNETVIGLEADMLFLHKIPVPISLEYLYNPNIQDTEQFRLLFGASF